jgi:hypothetical protein
MQLILDKNLWLILPLLLVLALPLMLIFIQLLYRCKIPTLLHSTFDLPFLEHLLCAAGTNPDVLHYGAMLKDADRPAFKQDMVCEVNDLLHSNTVEWSLHSSVLSNTKILPSIWSFRRKRAPDWTILKHKARLCPHGGKQVEGEHFWESYASVINWRTVCLVLILSLLANLKADKLIMSLFI